MCDNKLTRKTSCIHKANDKPYILSAAIHFDDDTVHPHQPKNIITGFVN